MPRLLTTEEYIEKAKSINGDKYSYVKTIYNRYYKPIIVTCNRCGEDLKVTAAEHVNTRNKGCKKCYRKPTGNTAMSHDEFIRKATKKHGDKYEYLTPYITTKHKITIKCKKCGNEFVQTAGCHLHGDGCRKCATKRNAKKRTLSVGEFEGRCSIAHDNKYIYHQDYIETRKKVRITCKFHQYDFYQAAYAHLWKKHGCPICSGSKGEDKISTFLKVKGVIYEREHKIKGCSNDRILRFDFYLPDFNAVIEFDGIQHFEAVDFFGGTSALNSVKKRDKIKNLFCKKNKIPILRIPYFNINKVEFLIESFLHNIK